MARLVSNDSDLSSFVANIQYAVDMILLIMRLLLLHQLTSSAMVFRSTYWIGSVTYKQRCGSQTNGRQ